MKTFTTKALVLLITFLSLVSCGEKQEYKTPKGLISDKIANAYEENYKKHVFQPVNRALSQKDIRFNREVWFSLEEMENYIHYIKQESKSLGYEKLGVRVYSGAKINKNGVIETTVFFTPTHSEVTRSSVQNQNSSGISSFNYGSSGDPHYEFEGGE